MDDLSFFMSVIVILVETKQQFKDFLQVPFNLHKKDPNWVPPLLAMVKDTFNKCNPFFKQANLQSWVAYKDKKPVGRISGIIHQVHNQFHNENIAFWGFFETDDCEETTTALFKEVESWASSQGMNALRGPMNPSTNHECGMQISAFDTKPFVMMTQNPDYYPRLVEKQGYKKNKDLQAWIIDASTTQVNPRLIQKIKGIQKRNNITIRSLNMKRFDEEVETIFQIYNDAWEKNWGFIPLTEEEYRHAAKDLKSIIIPELVYILEKDNEPVAFSVWLPDLNQALIHIRDGKLFPTGLLKLLWHTKIKKSMTQGRVPILGVKKQYQHLPLGGMLYAKYLDEIVDYGYSVSECSWILEDNIAMGTGLKLIGANHYKTYRIYEKSL